MLSTRQISTLVVASLLTAGLGVAASPSAQAAAPVCTGSAVIGQTVECTPNGAGYATITVPSGVGSITVTATGGGGGKNLGFGNGGAGGNVTASVSAIPGSVLKVYVGEGGGTGAGSSGNIGGTGYGAGGAGGPFYGSGFGGGYGGGGGGSSAVLIDGTVTVVAGGGGGGGFNYGGAAYVYSSAAGSSGGGDGTCSIGGGGGNTNGSGSAGSRSGTGATVAATSGYAGAGGQGTYGAGGASSGGGGGGGGYGGGGPGNWTGGVAGSSCSNSGGGGGGGNYVIGSASSATYASAGNGGTVGAGGDGSVSITFVAAPATAPGPPTSLIFTGVGETTMTVNWTPPADDGGSALLGYDVTVGAGTPVRVVSPVYELTGLTASTNYSLSITAVNAVGPSTALTGSQTTSAPSATVPGPPTNAVFSGVTSTAITVGWTAPTIQGTPSFTRYDLVVDSGSVVQLSAATTSYTATNLSADATHTFTITAVNNAGSSTALVGSQRTLAATAPTAVTNLASSVTQTSMTVTWAAPASDGGAPILAYKVRVDGGTITSLLPQMLTYTEMGLVPGTSHTMDVYAQNSVGLSPLAPASATTSAPSPSISAPNAMVATPISISLANYTPGSTPILDITAPDNAIEHVNVNVNGSGAASVAYTPTQAGTYLLATAGQVASSSFLSSATPPNIMSVSPATGSTAGGTSLTITGMNLAVATSVTVGGSPAAITSNTASQIVVTTPSGSGASDVVVTTAYGSATSIGAFTYTASGGGGSGGGGSGGGSSSGGTGTSSGTSPSTSSPTTAWTSPIALTIPAVGSRQVATIPGYSVPLRIKSRGTTVLVPGRLRTADGIAVRATAEVHAVRISRTQGAASRVGARIVRTSKGGIGVVTTGTRPVIVTLHLAAPGTATTKPLRKTHTWRVPAEKLPRLSPIQHAPPPNGKVG